MGTFLGIEGQIKKLPRSTFDLDDSNYKKAEKAYFF